MAARHRADGLRYLPDGTPDPGFGPVEGIAHTPRFGDADVVWAVALEPDGQIAVAGRGGPYDTSDVVLARFDGDPNTAPSVAVGPGGSCNASAAGSVDLHLADGESPAENLTLTAASSNPALLPDSALSLGGSGATRTLTATPIPDVAGSADVTVTVSDGLMTATASAHVVVGRGFVFGTDGPDILLGSTRTDILWAAGGHDLLCGGRGNDLLIGGAGDDTLAGDEGRDVLLGASGADAFSGGPGVDFAVDLRPDEGDTQDGNIL